MVDGSNFHFSTGVVRAEPLRMGFADGEHVIPWHIVAQAGGVETLQANQAALAGVPYEDFARAVNEEAVAAQLRQLQSQLINQSLGGGRTWRN